MGDYRIEGGGDLRA